MLETIKAKREIKYKLYIPGINKTYQVMNLDVEPQDGRLRHATVWEHPCVDTAIIKRRVAKYVIRDGVVLREYTGLKDKNGKEIYEGDIVSSPHFKDAAGREHELRHAVKWSDKYHGWFLLNCGSMNEDSGSIQLFVARGIPLRITGNIHENPELIT